MSLFSDYIVTLEHLLKNVEYQGCLPDDFEQALREAASATELMDLSEYQPDNYCYIGASNGMVIAAFLLLHCAQQYKKVIWIGNGGSAAIASHGAIDCWKNGGVKSLSFNEGPLLTCMGNDYGFAEVFRKPVEMLAEPDDVLIAISSSGQSKNILNAVQSGREKGCKVITMSGFKEDNPLRQMGDLNFYVPSGHYGHVELVHGILSHCLIDLVISYNSGVKTW